MSEWLNKVFSGGVSLARVNKVGIALMALAVVLIAVAQPVSNRWMSGKGKLSAQVIKLAGLLICVVGALIAIL